MTDPAPNWYPDPADPDQLRWWDGQAWTQHTQPATPQTPQQAPTTDPTPADPTPTTQIPLIPEQPSFEQPGPGDVAASSIPPWTPDPATPPASPGGSGDGGSGRGGAGGRLALIVGIALAAILLLGIGVLLLLRGDDDNDIGENNLTTTTDPNGDPVDTSTTAPDTTDPDTTTTDTTTPETTVPDTTTTEPTETTTAEPAWIDVTTGRFSIRLPPDYLILDATTADGPYRTDRIAEHLRQLFDADVDDTLQQFGEDNLFALTIEELDVIAIWTDDGEADRMQTEQDNRVDWLIELGVDPDDIRLDNVVIDGIESARLRSPDPLLGLYVSEYRIPVGDTAMRVLFLSGPNRTEQQAMETADAVIATLRIR